MELDGSQADRMGNTPDAFGAELVYKDTHQRDEWRQCFDNRLGLRRFDVTRAAFVKIEAQRIGAQVDRLARIFKIRYAADLDSNHVQSQLKG